MILKWKHPRLKIVPLSDFKGSVTLVQGYNDISDDDYKEIEKTIKFSIENGDIEVIRKEISVNEDLIGDGKKGKGKGKVKKFVAIPFKNLAHEKKVQIISETDDLKSLEKWLSKESGEVDEVIRIDIKKRIEEVKIYLKTGVKPKDQ